MNNLRQPITKFFECRKDVKTVILFGSFARQQQNKQSDVDIAVLFDPHSIPDDFTRIDEQERLSALIHRDVDLVVFNHAPPILKHEIFKNAEVLVQNDHSNYLEFWTKSLVEYCDLKKSRAEIEKKMLHWRVYGEP